MSAIKRGRNGDVLVVRTPATTLRYLTWCCANRRLNGALSLIAFGIALVDLVFTSLRHELPHLPITVTLIFVLTLGPTIVAAVSADRRSRWAGLPVIRLDSTGIQRRVRAAGAWERVINRPQRPHYDLAIAWGGASGWARGTDSKGRTVLLIAVSDPDGIVRQVTGSLAAGLEGNRSTFGTPLVIPVGVVDADELDNVEELLGKYLDQGNDLNGNRR